jgi:hypothetical protein
MVRFYLSSIFPSLDRILYLDNDVIGMIMMMVMVVEMLMMIMIVMMMMMMNMIVIHYYHLCECSELLLGGGV